MKKLDEILTRVDEIEKTSFVTAQFNDTWKLYAKKNIDVDNLIDIAHKQGRRAILLERALAEILNS